MGSIEEGTVGTHDSGKDFSGLSLGAEGSRPQWTRGLGL